MRLAYLSLALALGAPGAARAAPPGPSARGPTAHKSPAHHDTSHHAPADHHGAQPNHHTVQPNHHDAHHDAHHDGHTGQTGQQRPNSAHHDRQHPDHRDRDGHADGGQHTSSCQGKVLMVHCNADGKGGRVWMRDGRGQIRMFHAANAQCLNGVRPGSSVHLQANRQNATQIRVNGMSSSGGTSGGGQGTFSGRVVSAHCDRDGDYGSLAVQANQGGRTRHFKVTGATHFSHSSSGNSGGQGNQFVRPGQSVTVHCHGDHAMQIDVHSRPGGTSQGSTSQGGKPQGGSSATACNTHAHRTK